jgi:zinc transporter ZupT
MRYRIILPLLLLLAPLGGEAQQRPERSPEARVQAALGTALDAGIPVSLLERKVAEGKAKGVPMARIAAAVENRLAALTRAREALRRGRVEASTPADLSIAADAVQAGVSETALAGDCAHGAARAARRGGGVLTNLVALGRLRACPEPGAGRHEARAGGAAQARGKDFWRAAWAGVSSAGGAGQGVGADASAWRARRRGKSIRRARRVARAALIPPASGHGQARPRTTRGRAVSLARARGRFADGIQQPIAGTMEGQLAAPRLGGVPVRDHHGARDRAGRCPFFLDGSPGGSLGIANALAAGLMIAASLALVVEGYERDLVGTLVGALLGVAFIALSHRVLSRQQVSWGELSHADALKVLLMLGVMTLHSFTEGVGVGVSFGGGEELGIYITLAIAIHNIPEGLAICLVMVPRGTSPLKAGLWSVFSSLPQPLMAVPAFLLVSVFTPFLAPGLGFAAGAMLWMVASELIPEARRDAPAPLVFGTLAISTAAMLGFQALLHAG